MPVGPRRPHTIYKRVVTATAFSEQQVCRAIRVCLRERPFDSNFSTSWTRRLRTGKPSRRKSAMSNEYSLKDSVKCLDGVDYEVVKVSRRRVSAAAVRVRKLFLNSRAVDA